MAISPDSTCALTGSKDGSLCIVNITTGRVSTFAAFNIIIFYFCVNLFYFFIFGLIKEGLRGYVWRESNPGSTQVHLRPSCLTV
jgi:tellurite resistance protein TehA-like permease